tara:strand:+ start:174 stop:560 length:387 start_codon:yes stop_codon:yes gene_type:complete
MKILGIGVDIIDNKRIKRSIKNDKFVKRIFSKKEINNCKNFNDKVNFLAKRFAAKEALSKTFGTGFRSNLNYKDIQILNDKMGKPYYLISKKIKDVIYAKFKKKNINLFLSISDEKDYSIAFAILQTK